MFKYLGLAVYAVFRTGTLLRNRVTQYGIESYLALRSKSCGSVRVTGHSHFACVHGLEIGQNVGINAGAYWVCDGGLKIGDNCRFGRNVTIYTRNHNYRGSALPYDETNVMRPVKIGDNVWVGINVTILPGAEIRDGAIIGAGCVIAGVVDKHEIRVAPKAEVLKSRDVAHYEKLLNAKQFLDQF